MKVLAIKKSFEKCAEAGWFGYDFILDTVIEPDFVHYLSKLGSMIFLRSLKEPFFKIENDGLIVKGICNQKNISVAVRGTEEESVLAETEKVINTYGNQ
jgi:hypothetical protein